MPAKHPEVKVNLVGVDGNAFSIMAVVSRALKRAGHHDSATEYVNRVMNDAQTYEQGIQFAFEYVEQDWDDDEDDEDDFEDDFDSDDDPEYD